GLWSGVSGAIRADDAWTTSVGSLGGASSPCFFQAEDGIRDWSVTGVQTCALPIFHRIRPLGGRHGQAHLARAELPRHAAKLAKQIGRASCRERVQISGGAECVKK